MVKIILTIFFLLVTLLIETHELSAATIRLYQPDWQQASLKYRIRPEEKFKQVPMVLKDGWWRVKVEGESLEFAFTNGKAFIDLGKTLGCYENSHYSCIQDEPQSQNFRSSFNELWIKNGLVFISNPLLEKSGTKKLTVLSLNLHTYQEFSTANKQEQDLTEDDVKKRIEGHDDIFNRIAAAINQLDPDIVCLQEVAEWAGNKGAASSKSTSFGEDNSNSAKQILKRLDNSHYYSYMDWSHYGWDLWKEGSAILSKYPFIDKSSRYISQPKNSSETFWKSRKVPRVAINIPKLGKINVYSVHTGWWEDEIEPFRQQFENLMAWVNENKNGKRADNQPSNESNLLCGDFNQAAGTIGYKLMTEHSGFLDQYLLANPKGMYDATIGGKIAGWENSHQGQRVDYLLLDDKSPLIIRQSQRIFTEKVFGRVSDHTGIYGQFEYK